MSEISEDQRYCASMNAEEGESYIFIPVEGNIGSGKTTFLRLLQSLGFAVLEEPIDRIMNFHGHNLLDHFQKYLLVQDEVKRVRDDLSKLCQLSQTSHNEEMTLLTEFQEMVTLAMDASDSGVHLDWVKMKQQTGRLMDQFRNIDAERNALLEKMETLFQAAEEHDIGRPFSIQMAFFFTRVQSLAEFLRKRPNTLRINGRNVIFVERSIHSDSRFFEENLFREGRISRVEHDIYQNIWRMFYNDVCPEALRISAFVFIHADPHTCYERKRHRNRDGEDQVPEAYLENLGRVHDDFFADGGDHAAYGPTLVIDNTKDYRNDEVLSNEIKTKVFAFLNEICTRSVQAPTESDIRRMEDFVSTHESLVVPGDHTSLVEVHV